MVKQTLKHVGVSWW